VPHTHDFQVWLPYDAGVAAEAAVRTIEETGTALFAGGWERKGPGLACTEVYVRAAGLEWTAEDVKAAVAEFVARLSEEADGQTSGAGPQDEAPVEAPFD
jgi:hypothetical protein